MNLPANPALNLKASGFCEVKEMLAYRCLRCGCIHGWFTHPAVTPVRKARREPNVAGSLPSGLTGMNWFWSCPRCGAEHGSTHGDRPRIAPQPNDVRVRAYFLWAAAGRPIGNEMHFWLAAECELRCAPAFEMVLVS